MIERYTLPEMGRIWSDAHKYELWCRVEVLVLEAHARAGTVPADSVAPVRSAPPPTPEAVARGRGGDRARRDRVPDGVGG
jgi:adenylosuccinate lyase